MVLKLTFYSEQMRQTVQIKLLRFGGTESLSLTMTYGDTVADIISQQTNARGSVWGGVTLLNVHHKPLPLSMPLRGDMTMHVVAQG
jgi:hypothetical protein